MPDMKRGDGTRGAPVKHNIPTASTIMGLLRQGLTVSDIAIAANCSRSSIYYRCPGAAAAIGKKNFIKSLRATQWEVAIEDKNVAMLKFLGKQYLNQSEEPTVVTTTPAVTAELRSDVQAMMDRKQAEQMKAKDDMIEKLLQEIEKLNGDKD